MLNRVSISHGLAQLFLEANIESIILRIQLNIKKQAVQFG